MLVKYCNWDNRLYCRLNLFIISYLRTQLIDSHSRTTVQQPPFHQWYRIIYLYPFPKPSKSKVVRTAMNSSADEKAIVQDMKVASLEVLRRTAQDVFHEKILVSNLIKQVPPPKNADNDDDDENDIADNQNNTHDNNNTYNNDTHHNIIPNNDILNDIRVHKIDEQDMVIGRVLGRGAFCVVKECSCPIFSFSNAYSVGGETNRSFSSKLSSFSLSARYNRIMSKNSKKNTTSGNGMRSEPRDGDKNNSSGAFSNGNGFVSETSSLSTGSIGGNNDQNHHNKKIASSRSSPGGRKNGSSGRKKYKTRYVMKQISSDLKRSDKINFLKGTVDLAMETRFLASIQHENVISLRGISNNGAFSDGYFIILERLNETLGQKVKGWMDMDRQCKGITGVFTGSKKKAHKLQMERISAAYDLAAAMEYLHQKDIVFRDLVSLFLCCCCCCCCYTFFTKRRGAVLCLSESTSVYLR